MPQCYIHWLLLNIVLWSYSHAIPFSRKVHRVIRYSILTKDGNVTLGKDRLSQRISFSWPWKKRHATELFSASNDAVEAELSTQTLPDSVHLRLKSSAMKVHVDQRNVAVGDDGKRESDAANKSSQVKFKILSYQDPETKKEYSGLNISKRKFVAWLQYTLGHPAQVDIIAENDMDASSICRDWLRDQWKSRRLLCDRTELLTQYDSEAHSRNRDQRTRKRGGFCDLLHLYVDRFYGILVDEQEDTKEKLQNWIIREYGAKETSILLQASFLNKEKAEQYKILQHFLEWFRSNFPYYYDRCGVCGSSYKEQKDTSEDKDDGTFLGYVFPSEDELKSKAGRTELYQCHSCQSYTRFARYNKAQAVLDSRLGRCGEYSMLLYRMLSCLGHEVRWIVDWSDHVWTEVLLQGDKWIHLDPCEAAVDQPHLYQDWGKQQTYIIGFYAPGNLRYTLLEDVTKTYTRDNIETIQIRREENPEEVQTALTTASEKLRFKLENMKKSVSTKPSK
jgi:Transglutaminase-like superfamily